jgi:DNA-binding NtrC family response regulator
MTTPVAGPRVLIADDQRDVLEALRLLLKGEGYEIDAASSPRGVLEAVQAREYDLVVIDLNYARDTTSGAEGLDLLTRLGGIDETLPVVVMTAWASVDVAVEAMRRGARDFVAKPWDNARLLSIVRTQLELGSALRRGQRLEAENRLLRGPEGAPRIVADAAAMRPVLEIVERVGPSDAAVLITGENGVGRFELADGGTLFLDEIANVPMGLQSKLLRVVETGEFERVGSSRTRRVDVRILSATNSDLHAEVAAGRFRQDLLFRLNTIEIRVPPLRERRTDIPLLAQHFLRQHAQRYRKKLGGFEPAALEALLGHPWPGNVRELDHAVERAVLMAQGTQVRSVDLGLRAPGEESRRLEDMSLEEVEAFLIKKALARYEGNVSRAAEALGLSRSALYRRLQRYGL